MNIQTLAQDLPFDGSVKRGRLTNGMMYYLKKNAKPEKRAELRLVVDAGSLLEDKDQLGLAHFVEHMAFNGTKNFAKNELVDFLELTGTRFGADLNAYTSFDETVYQLQVRTDSMELLDKGLLILQDWAGAITFDPEEIDKERGVVISEWRTRLSPDQRLQQQFFPVLYQDSRYAERLPIGDPEIIKNASPAVIKRFYTDWYRPDLMAIVAVGDFDLAEMEAKIITQFSKLKKPESPRKRTRYSLPLHEEQRNIVATDAEAPFTQIRLQIKQKGNKISDQESYKEQLKATIYNRMLGARLYELQQTTNPPFTFSTSAFSSNLGETDAYSISAFVGVDKAKEGFAIVYAETIRALQYGFTSTELERAKQEILIGAERNFKEKENIKSNRLASTLVYHYLQDIPVLSPEQYLELQKTLLPEIKLEDINVLPKKWIKKNNRTLIITGPEKDSALLPQPEQLNAIMDSIEQSKQLPYIDKVNDEPLFSEQLEAVAIVDERYYEEFDITELSLANGVKVVMKPTTFKEDEILMQAYSPGGHSLVSDKDYQSATTATTLASLSGLGPFSSPELQKKLSGKKVGVGPYINELFEGFGGSASPDDLETMFQLLYLHFTNPRFESQSLEGFKQRQNNILQNIIINPYYYFGNAISSIKYGDHPRRKGIPTMEDLESIDIKKAEAFYKERFADASDFTFLFVGSFEVESMKKLLQTYLGNLPSNNRKEQFKDVNARLTKGIVDSVITRGAAPKSIIDITFHGDFNYNPQDRYDFNSMLAVLRILLRDQLREELGGVYGVNVSGFNTKRPVENYRIGIRFTAEPEMVDTLISTTYKVIKQLQSEGPAQKEIEKVRETQIQSRIKAEKENSYWMSQLNYRFQDGMPVSGIATSSFRKYVDALNPLAVQNAAKQYFDFENYLQLVLMPE